MVGPDPAPRVPLATLLEWLFPGHPARMIKLTRSEDGQKQVVTYPRGARSGDYARHLAIGATAGPGAIGLFPGYPEKHGGEGTQQKARWLVGWAALDFDGVAPETLHGLIQAFWDDGLPCYPSRGTTGRGAHLFFFFMQPLDQPKAVRGLQTLTARIEALGLPRPELRPSSPYSPGNGILLPYRGADRDGLGANPILDPVSLKPIPLADFNPLHLEAEDWVALLRYEARGEGPKDEKRSAFSDRPSANEPSATQRWNAELLRLAPFWTAKRRQDLTLGLTAFGCYLGLPAGKVSVDLQAFLAHNRDPELGRRLGAVERTLKKHAQGERISYRYWYARAGVEAPSAAREKPEALQRGLIQLRQHLRQESWRGEGGLSDYAVYKTLVETAEQYGELETASREPRLSITLSRRDLLLRSGLASLKTLYKSLQRLSRRGLVVSGVPSRGTQSGGFFLPLKPCNTHSVPPLPPIDSCTGKISVTPPTYPRAAFRRVRGLGKLAELLLDKLMALGGRAGLAQLAAESRRSKAEVERVFTSLNFYQVIDFTSDQDAVTLAPNWPEALLEAARRTGALDAIARLRARFARERAERRKAFWRKTAKQGVVLKEPMVYEAGERGSEANPLGP